MQNASRVLLNVGKSPAAHLLCLSTLPASQQPPVHYRVWTPARCQNIPRYMPGTNGARVRSCCYRLTGASTKSLCRSHCKHGQLTWTTCLLPKAPWGCGVLKLRPLCSLPPPSLPLSSPLPFLPFEPTILLLADKQPHHISINQ